MPFFVSSCVFCHKTDYPVVFTVKNIRSQPKHSRYTFAVVKRDGEHLCCIWMEKCSFISTDMLQSLRIGVAMKELWFIAL